VFTSNQNSDTWQLGKALIKNYFTIFDHEKGRIGLVGGKVLNLR
jgi:hypothetical protein